MTEENFTGFYEQSLILRVVYYNNHILQLQAKGNPKVGFVGWRTLYLYNILHIASYSNTPMQNCWLQVSPSISNAQKSVHVQLDMSSRLAKGAGISCLSH